jgi:hypothetical protein
MTTKTCPNEEAVVAASRSGDWSPELAAHRDGCQTCAELTLVVAVLASDAECLAGIDAPLPDPTAIWLRARLASREHQYRRATRAIVWIQRAAFAVAMAVGVAFAPGLWGFLARAFADLSLSFSVPNLPRAAGSPLLVLVVSMVVLGLLAVFELTAIQER